MSKTLKQLSAFAIAAVLLTSCANTAHIEKDPSANLSDYKTYSWISDDNGDKKSKAHKNDLNNNKIFISVVTGVLISEMETIIQQQIPLFRAMPNTAIAIQQSMTCVCSKDANSEQIEYVNKLFEKLGKVVTIDEKLMEAATILGACGIAYALRFIRANIQGGIEIGFDATTASLIASQTVKGSAELLIQTGKHPEQEIDKVTTPKGCTIAGLNEMEHRGFSSSLIRGVVASYKKIAKD